MTYYDLYPLMIFYEFFKTQLNNKIKLELKNNLKISGILLSIDPFLNFSLDKIEIENIEEWQGLKVLGICTIRGSSIKFAYIDSNKELIKPLQIATRYRFIINEQKEINNEEVNL